MKKKVKEKIHNIVLWLITWGMAVAFGTSAWMWQIVKPEYRAFCFIIAAVSALWVIVFVAINFSAIEEMCDE